MALKWPVCTDIRLRTYSLSIKRSPAGRAYMWYFSNYSAENDDEWL